MSLLCRRSVAVALCAALTVASGRAAEKPEEELIRLRGVAQQHLCTVQLLRAQTLLASDPAEALALLENEKACPVALRDFSWAFLVRQARRGGRTFKAHNGSVEVVAFSADGRTLVTASGYADNLDEVKVWESATQKLRHHFKGVTFPLAFSPNGKYLATVRPGGKEAWSAVVWDVATGKEQAATPALEGVAVAIHVSDDAKRLRTASRLYNAPVRSIKGVEGRVWDLDAGRSVADWLGEGDGFPSTGVFSVDGKRLAVAAYTWAVRVRDADTGKELFYFKEGHTSGVTHVAMSRDARVLSAETGDGGYGKPQVKVWDLTTGKSLSVYRDYDGSPGVVALDREGKLLASLAAPGAVVWEVPSGRRRIRFPGGPGTGRSLDLKSDGSMVATGGTDGFVALWPLSSDLERITLEGNDGTVGALAFSPDGKTLVSGSGRSTGQFPAQNVAGDFVLWDVATGKYLTRVEGHVRTVSTLAFSPDGKLLASGALDAIKVWDAPTRKELHMLRNGASGIRAVRFAPDSKTLISAAFNGAIHRWDATTGKELGPVAAVEEGVADLALSADGRLLAVATRPALDISSGGLRVIETATGKVRQRFKGHLKEVMGVALSRDSRTIAASGRGYLKLFDVDTEAERLAIDVPSTTDIRYLAFTPSGQELIVSVGRTVRVYDVVTGQERLRLPAEAASLALANDGKLLATGQEKSVLLWPTVRED